MSADSDYWLSLLRHAPLGLLTDFDGTLVDFASTPEAVRVPSKASALVDTLSRLPGVQLAIISGRPYQTLESYFPSPRASLLVAEHGAWRNPGPAWESLVPVDGGAIDSLERELRHLLERYPRAMIERKTSSIAFHYRSVPEHLKSGVLVQIEALVRPWLDAHPDFERLAGAEVVEFHPRLARKRNAVRWMRERLGPSARLVLIGDDVTDEDMFAAGGEGDASVLVTPVRSQPTHAKWTLGSPADVLAFLRAIVAVREGNAPPREALPVRVAARHSTADVSRHLLVVSNRLPELAADVEGRRQNVGGLVSALRPALARHGGVWLGWSGRSHPNANPTDVVREEAQDIALARMDFPEEWRSRYYNGVANGALWPLFHSFPARARFSHRDWEAYRAANEAFASVATTLVGPDEAVWVHDYHLLLLGRSLRQRGFRGRIGFFQHVPFCGPDVFFLLPWAAEVLEALLHYDLIGFHTQGYVENFLRCAAAVPGARVEGDRIVLGERVISVRAFPLGIIPGDFQPAGDATEDVAGLVREIQSRRVILSVDRLDYTKGIPEGIDAFGRLLELFPAWRRKVCLVQVCVPSRTEVPDYAEQRSLVEKSVGRINGEFAEADWVPVRYLYRSYGRRQLSELYRLAHVGYVTPLRDGMNLVAKEYLAAQDAKRPGVLVLSRFAGAAEELRDAVLTNPWDAEGMAQDLDWALRMSEEERVRRHARLMEVISRTTAETWAEDFLRALKAS